MAQDLCTALSFMAKSSLKETTAHLEARTVKEKPTYNAVKRQCLLACVKTTRCTKEEITNFKQRYLKEGPGIRSDVLFTTPQLYTMFKEMREKIFHISSFLSFKKSM